MGRKLSQKEFEDKVSSKFPDVIIKGVYKGRRSKISFGCKNDKTHLWETTPDNLFCSRFNGCPFCGRLNTRKTHENFVKEMKIINPNIEILEEYNGDAISILVRHKDFENHIWKATPSNLLRGEGCPYCSNKRPLRGFNTFGDYYPELIKFLKNPEEAYKYTYGSGAKVKIICPDCGTEKEMKIVDLVRQGFSCRVCSDNVSVPNKFGRNIILLKKDILQDFKFEYQPKWAKLYFYDIYFKYKDKTYIVEIQGLQHKTGKWQGKEINVKEHDKDKYKLAKENEIDYYIYLEADESNLKYLKESFYKTELKNIFDLTESEWLYIGQKMNKSILVEVCNYFNDNPGIKIKSIAEYFHIHHLTVSRYLKKGTKIGLCIYSKGKTRGKHILVINQKTNQNYVYSSVAKCKQGLEYEYNDIFATNCIYDTLKKRRKNYKGFNFTYLNEIDNKNIVENRKLKTLNIVFKLFKNGIYIDTFNSLMEAQRKTGINKNTFSAWIKGKRVSKDGYTVELIEKDYL